MSSEPSAVNPSDNKISDLLAYAERLRSEVDAMPIVYPISTVKCSECEHRFLPGSETSNLYCPDCSAKFGKIQHPPEAFELCHDCGKEFHVSELYYNSTVPGYFCDECYSNY